MKTKFLYLCAIIFGSISLLAAIGAVYWLGSDIAAGAFSGIPETGYGVLFSILLTPVVILFGLSSFACYRSYKRRLKTMPNLYLFWLIIIAIAVVFIAAGTINDLRSRRPTDAHDAAMETSMQTTYQDIISYYDHNHSLPPTQTTGGFSYAVVDAQTHIFRMCSSFDLDTRSYYSDRDTQPINNNQILDGSRADEDFAIHNSGNQCYIMQF